MCSSDLARLAIKSVVERIESGGGLRYVASMMSRGINGCVPVMIKYGETPKRFQIVMRSAQKTEYSDWNHFDSTPSAALIRA